MDRPNSTENRNTGTHASIRSTCPKPKRSAPTPSWKTSTNSPYAAPTESRLTAIAVSATTIERKARVSRTNVRARTKAITIGSRSRKASIDVSTLSRLEAGKRRLALDHLPALAGALGVSADDLLGCAPTQDPRVRERPHRHDGMTMWPLTRRGPAGGPPPT